MIILILLIQFIINTQLTSNWNRLPGPSLLPPSVVVRTPAVSPSGGLYVVGLHGCQLAGQATPPSTGGLRHSRYSRRPRSAVPLRRLPGLLFPYRRCQLRNPPNLKGSRRVGTGSRTAGDLFGVIPSVHSEPPGHDLLGLSSCS